MARGINKVTLVGNVGNDPETIATQSGSTITNLSLATDESYKDKNTGQMVPKTEWHKIVMFNRLAEIARDYLKKGSKVYIEGKLQTRKWQDNTGADRYSTEIVAHEMLMLDSKPEGEQAPTAQAPQQRPQTSNQPNPRNHPQQPVDDFDENLPF